MRVGEIGHFEESRFRQPLRYKYLKRKNRVWNYFCPKLIDPLKGFGPLDELPGRSLQNKPG